MTPAEVPLAVATARAALRAMAATHGGPGLPEAAASLARAHLVQALEARERKPAIEAIFRAADLAEVLLSIGRRTGQGTEIFLDDDYSESFVPNAVGPHPWWGCVAFVEAFDLTAFAHRAENYAALVDHFRFVGGLADPPALTAYATMLARVAESSQDDYDGVPTWLLRTRKELATTADPLRRWLTPRVDAWEAFENGRTPALAEALVAIADVGDVASDAIAAGLGFSLGASAMLAYAEWSGRKIDLVDPRIRRLPPKA